MILPGFYGPESYVDKTSAFPCRAKTTYVGVALVIGTETFVFFSDFMAQPSIHMWTMQQ